jgi:hypothetical protein
MRVVTQMVCSNTIYLCESGGATVDVLVMSSGGTAPSQVKFLT